MAETQDSYRFEVVITNLVPDDPPPDLGEVHDALVEGGFHEDNCVITVAEKGKVE